MVHRQNKAARGSREIGDSGDFGQVEIVDKGAIKSSVSTSLGRSEGRVDAMFFGQLFEIAVFEGGRPSWLFPSWRLLEAQRCKVVVSSVISPAANSTRCINL